MNLYRRGRWWRIAAKSGKGQSSISVPVDRGAPMKVHEIERDMGVTGPLFDILAIDYRECLSRYAFTYQCGRIVVLKGDFKISG